MSQALSPLARLRFSSDGISANLAEGSCSLDAHLASILEVFAHDHHFEAAFRAYNCLLELQSRGLSEWSNRIGAGEDSNTAVLIVGKQILGKRPVSDVWTKCG